MGALVAAMSLLMPAPTHAAPALPDWDGAKKKPAPLPDWDSAKTRPADKPADKPADAAKQPAPLPDWDAEKAKQSPTKPPAAKSKKPAKKPAPAEAPAPEPVAEPEPAPALAPAPEIVPEAPAVVEEPPAAAIPEPAAAVDIATPAPKGPPDRTALRRARGEMISGGVLMALGLGGFGAMTAGVLLKRSAEDGLEDMTPGADADLRRGETILAAGAVAGVMGLVIGVALLREGARDLKSARAQSTARVRVTPTFGGLVIRGRF